MMKFLLIIGGFFFLIYMVLNGIKNKIVSSFTGDNFTNNQKNYTGRNKNDEVVYEKDDTVILKGEAKNDSKKYNY